MKFSLRNVVLLTVASLLAVALLSASSITLASHLVTSEVNKRVRTTAAVTSVVFAEQTASLAALVNSYATRPSLIAGLTTGADGKARVDAVLASLQQASPGIVGAFTATLEGSSSDVYPSQPTVIGRNFAFRDWYKGLVRTDGPYVSEAIVTAQTGTPLAVTIVAYVHGTDGVNIAIVGVNYTLQSIEAFSTNIGNVQGIALTVADQAGTALNAGGGEGLVSLARDPTVQAARAGRTGLLEYRPALPGGGRGPKQLSAYAPVPGVNWTVTASVLDRVAFAGLNQLRQTVLAITGVLVLILLAGAWAMARSDRRRRKSELEVAARDRRLSRVLESTADGFVSVDMEGSITAWNTGAEQLFGWTATEVIGRNLIDTIIPPSEREAYRRDLTDYHAGDESPLIGKRLELTAWHRDGREIPVELGVWADDDGGGFSAFVHDITERANIQAALEAARDQAMQASQLKSEFLANMSHEIRTPMNGVIGMSGLLLHTDLDAEQRDFAETVSSSAEALLTVIDDILDFSKIEAGKLDVERVSFDLRSVVEESAVLLAARAQQIGLELTCEIDPAMPAVLRGDPGRIRQVLLNLLGNAVKFTAAGEVNLKARVVGEDVNPTVTVELAVSDTGIGIAAATLDHLFDPFTQADTSTTRRYGGTGLGLAISRQLVELMGGTLSVVSEQGLGSTFSAIIPFGLGASAPGATEFADLIGIRALIVDDNTTNQRVLEEMTTAWGCSATSAAGAQRAMIMLQDAADAATPFDVVLLDLNMPDIDGYGLARLVASDSRLASTPMIMLTSSAQRGEAEKTEQAGIVAYLTKPVRSAQLRSALNGALGTGPVLTPDRAFSTDPKIVSGTSDSDNDSHLVLLVEDNVVNRKVVIAMLASIDYRVDVAVNGAQALEMLGLRRYAAILMDCQMPVMDGYQATRELRRREGVGRHTPVIALTASAMAADRVRCLDAGMDDYLSKPISGKNLGVALGYWVQGQQVPAPIALVGSQVRDE